MSPSSSTWDFKTWREISLRIKTLNGKIMETQNKKSGKNVPNEPEFFFVLRMHVIYDCVDCPNGPDKFPPLWRNVFLANKVLQTVHLGRPSVSLGIRIRILFLSAQLHPSALKWTKLL